MVLFALVLINSAACFALANIKMFQPPHEDMMLPAWGHMTLRVCVGHGLMENSINQYIIWIEIANIIACNVIACDVRKGGFHHDLFTAMNQYMSLSWCWSYRLVCPVKRLTCVNVSCVRAPSLLSSLWLMVRSLIVLVSLTSACLWVVGWIGLGGGRGLVGRARSKSVEEREREIVRWSSG